MCVARHQEHVGQWVWRVAGCGKKGPARYRVSGSVTYKGKPVPVGAIQFTPDVSKGNTSPSAFAAIKDRRYDSGKDALEYMYSLHGPTSQREVKARKNDGASIH